MKENYLSNGDIAVAMLFIMFLNGSSGIDLCDALIIWLIK